MVILTRIDDRLLHGQVAFAWTKSLGVDAILVANDNAATDPITKMAIKMAAPNGVKLAIKTVKEGIELLNNPKSEKVKIFVVVKNTEDAALIAKEGKGIKLVNVGGIKKQEGKRMLTKAVFVDDKDITNLRSIEELGIEVEVRQVPTDAKKSLSELLK